MLKELYLCRPPCKGLASYLVRGNVRVIQGHIDRRRRVFRAIAHEEEVAYRYHIGPEIIRYDRFTQVGSYRNDFLSIFSLHSNNTPTRTSRSGDKLFVTSIRSYIHGIISLSYTVVSRHLLFQRRFHDKTDKTKREPGKKVGKIDAPCSCRSYS